MGINLTQKPENAEYPFVFNHRYGTVTYYAKDALAAVEVAKFKSRGMPVTPAFTVPVQS